MRMLVSDFKNGQIISVNDAEKSGNFPLGPRASLSLDSEDCDMLLSVSRAPILHLAMVQPRARYTLTLNSYARYQVCRA